MQSSLDQKQIDRLIKKYSNPYEKYQSDPIGFGKEILGHTYYSDIEDLMLSVRDNPVTLAKSCNGVGKTFDASDLAIWFYKCFKPSEVYTVAYPQPKLKELLWGKIDELTVTKPKVFEEDNIRSLHIQNRNSFVTGVTINDRGSEAQREARFSGRHAPNIFFIIDEGDTIPHEYYRGIESCLSGGFCRLLILYNPREQIGPVWQMERNGEGNLVNLKAFNHPNVITGENIFPGAVSKNITGRRIAEWTRKLKPDEQIKSNCFELPEFFHGYIATDKNNKPLPPLEAGWYEIKEEYNCFSYMVLGEYPVQSESQLISKEWINRARTRWDLYVSKNGEIPPAGIKPNAGLDCAEMGTDKNVWTLRYGGWVPRPQSWQGVDVLVTGDRAVNYHNQLNPKPEMIQVDGTGIGAGVAPHIQRNGIYAEGVKVASSPTYKTELGEFGTLRDQLAWSCREWLRTDDTAMLPPNEELIEEMQAIKYEIKNGKIKITEKKELKKILKRSPDWFDSLCLTFPIYGTNEGIGFGGFA